VSTEFAGDCIDWQLPANYELLKIIFATPIVHPAIELKLKN
jgi:hypothetical protein